MSVEITALTRLRHTALWELSARLGNQDAVIEQLGISKATFQKWVTLRGYFPLTLNTSWPAWRQAWWHRVKANLESLTGQTIDELFPEALRSVIDTKAFCNKPLEQVIEIPEEALLDYARVKADQLRLPAPDKTAGQHELAERISGLLQTLSYRERTIVKLRYGLDGFAEHTLAEVGEELHLSPERVREIQARAVRKLQQPHRSLRLVGFTD